MTGKIDPSRFNYSSLSSVVERMGGDWERQESEEKGRIFNSHDLKGSRAGLTLSPDCRRKASLYCFPIHHFFHDEEADHPTALLMFQDLSKISLISCIFAYVPYFAGGAFLPCQLLTPFLF